jgi:hypothetical protein
MFDHAVFVLYSLCFMSLLFVAITATVILGARSELIAFAALIPPVHIFAQLRGTYGIGGFSAFWRTAALLGITVVVLVLFFMFVLVMSMH